MESVTGMGDSEGAACGGGKRDSRGKQSNLMPLLLGGLVLVMFIAVGVRLQTSRTTFTGSCHYDHIQRRAVCRTKGLTSIPDDLPDTAVTILMGDQHDTTENRFPIIQRVNFTRFRYAEEVALVWCNIEEIGRDTFADLRDLRRLDLRYNLITTIAKSAFRGPIQLEYLLLSNNPIHEVGDSAFQGAAVKQLVFGNNPALGRITVTAFSDATVASLVFNRCNFTRLDTQVWSQLNDIGLREFYITNNLQQLNIDDNALGGLHLERLVLTNNGLTSPTFLRRGDFNEIKLDENPLETFDLDENDSSKSKTKIRLKTKILSLTGTKISKLDDDDFDSLPELEELYIDENGIRVFDADVFDDLDALVKLDLSDNIIEDFDGHFDKELPQLESLMLSGNRIQTLPESQLGSLFRRLKNLTLDGNPLHCNCELRWLAEWIESSSSPQAVKDSNPILSCLERADRDEMRGNSTAVFHCRPPTIVNTTFDVDGVSLVCIAEGDPAPRVTWIAPSGDDLTSVEPSEFLRDSFQTVAYLPVARNGNYTCSAVNIAGRTNIVVDTERIPSSGLRRFPKGTKPIQILSTPPGFILAATLIGILGYIFKYQ